MNGYQRPSQSSFSKAKGEETETKDSVFLSTQSFTCVLIFTSIGKSQDLRKQLLLVAGKLTQFLRPRSVLSSLPCQNTAEGLHLVKISLKKTTVVRAAALYRVLAAC